MAHGLSKTGFPVFLESGGYLFDPPLSMPGLREGDTFVYRNEAGQDTTYVVEQRKCIVEAVPSPANHILWRPAVCEITVTEQ